jgi:lysophospholipase L1-like esterase
MHNYSYLAIGDSYTIGEGVEQKDTFPFLLKEQLEKNLNGIIDLKVLAKTGWTCDQLFEAIIHDKLDECYSFITLCVGVNNQYQGHSLNSYYKSITQLYQHILKLVAAPTHIIVVSIPDYSKTPFVKDGKDKVRSQIELFNTMNRYVMKGASFVDITEMSGQLFKFADGLTSDDLHPSKKVYEKWVEIIEPIVKKILL